MRKITTTIAAIALSISINASDALQKEHKTIEYTVESLIDEIRTDMFYGNIEKFKAKLIKFEDLDICPDIMKINIEGYEKILVPSIPINIWEKCDAFIEIHSEEDRRCIFDYFNEIGVNIFSQKLYGLGFSSSIFSFLLLFSQNDFRLK